MNHLARRLIENVVETIEKEKINSLRKKSR